MAETARKRFDRMIHRWRRLELDNACHVNPIVQMVALSS